MPTLRDRASGVLLHVTSLPGPHGNGDLGAEAHAFAELLARSGQRWWQMLPVGPPGYGDSPYSALSAFAGNPARSSTSTRSACRSTRRAFAGRRRRLRGGGRVPREASSPRVPGRSVAPGARALELPRVRRARGLLARRLRALRGAEARARRRRVDASGSPASGSACRPRSSALARSTPRRSRSPSSSSGSSTSSGASCVHTATTSGIGLIGDLPIFVAHDSADVWQHPELFKLDDDGRAAPPSPASRPTTSARPASAGAIRSTAGRGSRRPATRGGSIACARRSSASTPSGSTTSSASRATGRSRPHEPTAMNGRWMKGPGPRALRRRASGARQTQLPLHRRGPRRRHAGGARACATRSACPGMRILQFAFGDDPQADAFFRTTTPRARSSTRARTTTTRSSAGSTTRGGDASDALRAQAEAERRAALAYLGRTSADLSVASRSTGR